MYSCCCKAFSSVFSLLKYSQSKITHHYLASTDFIKELTQVPIVFRDSILEQYNLWNFWNPEHIRIHMPHAWPFVLFINCCFSFASLIRTKEGITTIRTDCRKLPNSQQIFWKISQTLPSSSFLLLEVGKFIHTDTVFFWLYILGPKNCEIIVLETSE